jgi:predicted Zn-dependent protease
LAASAVVGVAGAVSLYQAADLGGDLVYAYAGGVGIRSGDPADVGRLLVAGLYHQAMLERKAGRPAEAAQLIGQLAQRYPDDTSVRLLVVESLLVDQHDGKAALAALQWFPATPDSRFLRFRVGLLRADALAATGRADSAKAVLRAMAGEFANNRAIAERMGKLN